MKVALTLTFFLLVVLGQSTLSQSKPPAVYRDRHICPVEGCDYRGTAVINVPSPVFTAIGDSKGSFFIKRGEKVRILDSEVHTRAGRFLVNRRSGKYRSGDVIWVYTYLGEGFFKVWYKGKMYQEDLRFSPWGGSAGSRCQDDRVNCFGNLVRDLDMKWWVKVRANNGKTGWVLANDRNLEWDDR